MDNDFKNIGKKMPYSTPKGFFQQMEAQLLAQAPTPRVRSRHPWIIVSSFTLAAALIIGIVLWTSAGIQDQEKLVSAPLYTWNENLSTQEAEAIYQLIENDLFLNEDINMYEDIDMYLDLE